MSSVISRIDDLDLSLFETIESQTSAGDRRSLLAVQRAVAKRRGNYAYLEIGSHLGGSIQPHLVDPRCTKIYSIDPRPRSQPDDRSPGVLWNYEDNSTARMLDGLKAIDSAALHKIQCFDLTASEVSPTAIDPKPVVAFIDGEHTQKAVLSDFLFCKQVVADGGVILFHDTWLIYPAIFKISKLLRSENCKFVPLMLEGWVYGIFFDQELIISDPLLSDLYKRNKYYLHKLRFNLNAKRFLVEKPMTIISRTKSTLSQAFS